MANAFDVTELTFTYRGRSRPALSHVTLGLEEDRTLGVLGHSGAGKSTLLAALAAVVPAVKKGTMSGDVTLRGASLAGKKPRDVAGDVAFVFEDFDAALVATTVEDEVAFGPRHLGVPAGDIGGRVGDALAACGLAGLEARRVETLSGGQKQRLAVAAALATDARLLLFDEAATDLDPAGKATLQAIITDLGPRGRTAVVADNEAAQALTWNEVALLGGGELVARGSPLRTLADEELCRRAGVAALNFLNYFERRGDGFRLLPGVEIGRLKYDEPPPAAGPPAVVADDLTLTYASGVTALSGFNLAIREGDFVALVGENGGGKTTFAKAAAGLLSPTAGEVLVGGRPPTKLSAKQRARAVGYLFQNPDHQIFQPTVREEVAFGPRQLGLPGYDIERRVAAAVAAVDLEEREDEDPFTMPKGDRQRVALASVLAVEPEILVMDEPTTGLDRREVASLMDAVTALNRRGTTVIFITHAMDVVAGYARRVAVVAGGRVAGEGTPREVLADDELLSRAGLRPPVAARLARDLGLDAVTGDELTRALRIPGRRTEI
ncbi:MAG TPA: ATP-binding cassette domain-containing protein [bacterium]|nr:ATP-binding cassette domain-containing protein [bacterium]